MSPAEPAAAEAVEVVTETLVWNGTTLKVSFQRNWTRSDAGADYTRSLIEIEVVEPEGAPLPITETGFRAHFVFPEVVDQAGGPAAFVRSWLDEQAKTAKWRKTDAAWRQLTLF